MKRINLPADLENIFLAVIVYKSMVFQFINQQKR